ncbi:conserved Plasmodium protein, unknown function [Plasmodium berghei]|uniref:Uncharacterized protein n=2 Tax=Plasmodium berghei TaxID=5821 RepID=A0A509AV53_PLABA|nr:conserved Plasmodium protein, unknown function [Plasmodium berghei ANKA]CXI82695.1 conserved Plasmodium protein, unknown function [Plasmodium berghei]SCM25649.1 conserved Plasmodium protein, unknown function [Plasmodium berghei]SCN27435.1 conserved Plasmodium protein, unknown function [Plasmodium berghei]SCO62129.1 conserved Plasmodium protein, unknown function [Plasmodium berghei]SCO63862.1 conserved Plasmodium protein, unknown function [Plasmodium berghei]|eukprot:XP_034423067.1 conserved Plasmodium protein, unknown function [Plasmodium berghei ANKA]
METGEDMEFLKNNMSIFEMSNEKDLKVNIINHDKNFMEYYTNKLKNITIHNVKYFDIDITDDVKEINDPFSVPIELNDGTEDEYFQYKVNKILYPNSDYYYAKKILSQDMNITINIDDANTDTN